MIDVIDDDVLLKREIRLGVLMPTATKPASTGGQWCDDEVQVTYAVTVSVDSNNTPHAKTKVKLREGNSTACYNLGTSYTNTHTTTLVTNGSTFDSLSVDDGAGDWANVDVTLTHDGVVAVPAN